MSMEQGVFSLLVWGFSAFMLCAFITVITLRVRYKHNKSAYNLLIAHFVVFSLAGIALLNAMTVNPTTSMASEDASMLLSSAGLLWAISMVCLLAGMVKFNSAER
ncbi:hypothetical protein [Thalassobacillus sp. CUG 92003]|uniref:hypothetical protein n=1 Tax=Thalassobacillus sp. CUG 92003 TaxID=2736641 RepID=UPI0015E67379|nr:hypothetical protein [Thalassobacillus sp. CUG 92003]